MPLRRLALFALCAVILAGCETTTSTATRPDPRVAAMIAEETPGNDYVGRRYYQTDYDMLS